MGNIGKVKQRIECTLCGRKLAVPPRKHCATCTASLRRFRMKWAAICLKGKKCLQCGKEATLSNMAAFQFHHNGGKELLISSSLHKSWRAIREELDKCVLLCACCHAIEHSQVKSDVWLAAITSYKGFGIPLDGGRFLSDEEHEARCADRVCQCGQPASKYSKTGVCAKCARTNSRKVERPSEEKLLRMVAERGYSALGREFGVSDKTIKKWVLQYEKERLASAT